MIFCFLGSKVCYDEDTNLTKKVREALKNNENSTGNSSSSSKNDDDGKENTNQTSSDSTAEQQNPNTKDADGESVKKRDKV